MGNLILILSLILFFLVLILYLIRSEFKQRTGVNKSLIRGIDYALSDEYDRAIEEMLKVVNRYRELAEPYISLGNLYRAKGDLEKAIQIHEEVASNEKVPAYLKNEAYYYLGIDYSRAGFYDRAAKIFDMLNERNPDDKRALVELEKIYVELEDWERAIGVRLKLMTFETSADKLREANNLLAHYVTERGKELIRSGKIDEAEELLRNALEKAPNIVDATLTYGDILYHKGEMEKLLNLLGSALNGSYDYHFLILDRLEKYFSNTGEYQKYGQLLQEKVEGGDYSPQIFIAYCKYLRKIGEIEKASQLLKDYTSRFPYDPEAVQLMADIMLEKGNVEESTMYYKKLSRLGVNPPKPFVCTNCGYRMEEMSWRCPKCGKWDTVKYMPQRGNL